MEKKESLADRVGGEFVNWTIKEYGLTPISFTDDLIRKAARTVKALGLDESIARGGDPTDTLAQHYGRASWRYDFKAAGSLPIGSIRRSGIAII